MACRKFAMVRISDNWYWPEIRPKVIRRSTISQKQINSITSWQWFNLFTTAIWYMFWYYSDRHLFENISQFILFCWEPFWGILGHFDVCSSVSWETFNPFLYIWYRCFCMTLTVTALKMFFTTCSTLLRVTLGGSFGPFCGIFFSISWKQFFFFWKYTQTLSDGL